MGTYFTQSQGGRKRETDRQRDVWIDDVYIDRQIDRLSPREGNLS